MSKQLSLVESELEYLVPRSLAFMVEHFPEDRSGNKQGYWHVAFSGGKDSIVLYDLVKRSGLPYKVHYVNTTIDPPELVRFIKEEYPEVEIIMAPPFFQIMRKKGYPMFNKRWCCDTQKKNPAPKGHILLGVRSQESAGKKERGEIAYPSKKKTNYHPIFEWDSENIWDYIKKERKLKYPELYDKGFHRLGCVVCPFLMHPDARRDRHIEQWPKHWAAFERNFKRQWVEYADRTEANVGPDVAWLQYIEGRKFGI